MPHATLPTPNLQALILCGPGISLNTFTSNPSDLPKALLPVANRPMVWYPLNWLYRTGITDITLITPPESAGPLESALATNPALTALKVRPEVLAPRHLLQTTGTGELLRLPEVQACVRGDFVVVPCDFVCEVEGTRVLQQWMTLNPLSSSTSMGQKKRKGGMAIFYPTHGLEGISTKKDESDFLATVPIAKPAVPAPAGSLREGVEEVVLNMPTDTLNDKVEEGKGFLRLRQSLMERHGRVKMRMKHRDAGVYFFPFWVKAFAARNEKFDSISEDLLGWWAKAGWQEGLGEKLGLREVLEGEAKGEEMESPEAEDEIDVTQLSSTKVSWPSSSQQPAPPFASRVGPLAPPSHSPLTIPPLLAYIQPAAESSIPLIRRVDTTPQLLTISLHLAKTQPPSLAHDSKIHPSATLEQQARVSQEDCLVGENVKLGFRSNVKESVIGANCEIGRNVRLTRCLLMEGCVVGDGVVMSGCVVGRRARVEGMKGAATEFATRAGEKKGKAPADDNEDERTKLTDCEVAPNYVVEAGTEAKGEKLMGFDTEGGEDLGMEGEDEDAED
ncbi:Translation initiation factor eIF-2B subunit gamma [Vermiconidia calcicola]|uniref:Translation initiation factor eIF-2B subunit gamma n=1 Tax=Vermiconidia calcicola TaxID=1690605 RepID=A0ACC3MET4_9PEZI|nr:Translation initiation factor eIF-2B subunit gamma [Vermiconidia calcicola]